MQVSKKLIENVGELKKALNEISVYDLDVYTSMELYYKIANKLNEVIKELSRFEGLVSDEVIKQNEKLIYLLGEGLNTEVVKKINQMVADGTMDTIINHNVFNSLNNKIEDYKEELSSQIKDNINYLNGLAIDVKFLGAKGDGNTLDTIAIKKAINLLNTRCNTLLFNNGTFLIDDVLLFEGLNEVNIIFKNAKIETVNDFNVSGTNDGLFTFNNCNTVNIEGLKINNFTTTNQQSFAIKLNTIEDVYINNIKIKNERACFNGNIGNLIQGEYVKNIKILNSSFIDNPNWHGIGFVGAKCGDRIFIDNCYFEDLAAYAMDIHSNIESIVTNCLIKNCHGICKNQYGSLKFNGNTFLQDENMIENLHGVDNQLIHSGKISETENAEYMIIENNYIKTLNSKCELTFHISNSDYVSIKNNYIERDSTDGKKTLGINFSSYNKHIKDVIIENNIIKLLKNNYYKGGIFYDECNIIIDRLKINNNVFVVNSNVSTYCIRVCKDVKELQINDNTIKLVKSGCNLISSPFNCIWVDLPNDQSIINTYHSVCNNNLITEIDNLNLVENLSLVYQNTNTAKSLICKDNKSKSTGSFRYGEYILTGNQNIVPNAHLIKV